MDASVVPCGLPFVGSHNIFPYGYSGEEGSGNRNLTDVASLSSIIQLPSSLVGRTWSMGSNV